MLLLALPGATLALVLLTLPGLIWAWWCYPAPDGATRLSVGLALGIALQLFALSLLGLGPGITRASILATTGALTLIAVLLAWRTHRPHHARAGQWRWSALQLALVLVALLIPRLIPLAQGTVPQGFDPSFHSLLASTTVATGHLPTWAPFEPIASNYPYGSHVLMAAISLIIGVMPHQAFAALLNLIVPLGTSLALYALTSRALRRHDIALGAVVAYGLLGNFGSLDYERWGGLPNALGFFLVLAFLLVLFAPNFTWYRIIIGGIILGAVPLTHHHVLLTAGLMLVAYAGFLVARGFGLSRHGSQAGHLHRAMAWRALLRLVLTSVIALAAAAFYLVPLTLRVGQIQDTSVLHTFESVPKLPLVENGLVLWALALFGAGMLYVPLFGYAQVRRLGRGGTHLSRAFIAIATVTLGVAFFLGHYVYIRYSMHVYHEPYVAFAPVRFLTDMTYFLGIYAGIGLAVLWNLGRRSATAATTRLMPEVEKKARALRISPLVNMLVRAIIVIGVVATTITTIWPMVATGGGLQYAGQLAPGEQEAFAWIQANTPKNALVINLNATPTWAPYFTQREVAFTPVPASEFTSGYVAEKQFIVRALLAAQQAPGSQILAVANTPTALNALQGRPVVLLTPTPVNGLQMTPAYTSGPERVYLLPDGFALLQPHPYTITTTTVAAHKKPRVSTESYTATTQWWTDTTSAPPDGWQSQPTDVNGWGDGTPASAPATGLRYGRIVLMGPLPPNAMIACSSEYTAQVWVDGVAVAGACSGKWVALPDVSTAGPHVVAFQLATGNDTQPWGDIFIRAGA
jgi:hypothetical protein